MCYFLWEKSAQSDCKITNLIGGRQVTVTRPLNQFPVFVRYNESVDIIQKVCQAGESSIVADLSSRNPFGLATSIRGLPERFHNALTLYSSQGTSYIDRSQVVQGHEYIDQYKIMLSRVTSEHAGEPDKTGMYKVISNMRLLEPGEVCTDSYILAHPTGDRAEAEHFYAYLQTKFARFLLLQALSSINLSRDAYTFVPRQDFSRRWSDRELYAKYGLSQEETGFIESMMKPME